MRPSLRALPFALTTALVALGACAKSTPQAPQEPAADASNAASPRDAALAVDASASADATTPDDASVEPQTALPKDPYGAMKESARIACAVLSKGAQKNFLAPRDLKASFVDGDDLLALVNRSPQGALAPDYAPTDMVDIVKFQPRSPADCEKYQCLRKDAASAMKELLAAMARAGVPGHIESVYRSYLAQCVTFQGWVKRSDFCSAAEQSALPGHSQHQLGTTIDLFTAEWKASGETVFRQGFGCTKGGKWLVEHAWEHGFVFPYPIHPDDLHEKETCIPRGDHEVPINPKTGYRYEHWHVRYIGKDAARELHAAESAKDPHDPDAISLEQWMRQKRGLRGDTDVSVCDGCNCGACASLDEANACGTRAIALDTSGLPKASASAPTITAAKLVAPPEAKGWSGAVLSVELDVPEHTLTQPPLVGLPGPGFADTTTTTSAFVPLPQTKPRAYPALAGAVRVGVRVVGSGPAFPYTFGLGEPQVGRTYNRANLLLPAPSGKKAFLAPLPKLEGELEVAVLKGGRVEGPIVRVAPKP
jgi:D-alanyl-D-alanine carboxypeptidase